MISEMFQKIGSYILLPTLLFTVSNRYVPDFEGPFLSKYLETYSQKWITVFSWTVKGQNLLQNFLGRKSDVK